jgi:N-acetylglucosaminyl-diphospho-decaprenol L-rhamnosyltransferase
MERPWAQTRIARWLSSKRSAVTENPTNTKSRPDISVVVVNYNTGHLLARMFAALDAATASLKMDVIVVDNASSDDSIAILESKFPIVTLIRNATNVGFGRANNQAIPHARGRYVLLLNTDAFVATDTLEKTIAFMAEHPRCGVLGVKLVGEDGSLQPSCRYFPTPWNVFLQRTGLSWLFPRSRLVDDMSWDHASVRLCDWVPGCYYLVRSEVVCQVGLFDPRFFLYYEEVDHCRAVKTAGWEVIYYPYTEVMHIGGESAKSTSTISEIGRQISPLQIESELLYFRKYYGLSGVIAGVALSTCADLLSALNGLLRGLDLRGVSSSARHISTVMRILGATGFATHPTR